MTKISKNKLLICLTMILIISVIIFFPYSKNFNNTSEALIEGLSGNKFVITGLVGNTPSHYFVNDNNESTLQNTQVKDTGQTHYSIVPTENNLSYYSGWAELSVTTDINELIKKGLVYAEASAIITTKKSNSQSNIKITLSQGENSVYVQSNNSANETSSITTDLLLLTDSSRIKFTFETVGNGSSSEKSDFIMAMPTIRLYTIINDVYLQNEDEEVTPGQVIILDAYNEITNVNNVKGNFLSYSKVNHQIKYEFISGENYVNIMGSSLYLSNDLPDGTIIQFRAYCYKSSKTDEIIYSDKTVTLKVNASQVKVSIMTDFENPASIVGNGLYYNGDIISLNIVSINTGFIFDGWYINGELETTKYKLSRYVVKAGDNIYAKFTKSISIAGVEVIGKVYDGTTEIDTNNIKYIFNGVEDNHQLDIQGITVSYVNASAGTNKALEFKYGEVSLIGENSDIYKLSSQIVPVSYATIYPRNVEIYPDIVTKQYGDSDPSINYSAKNVINDETLLGKLGREPGEEIGEYIYTLGTLTTSNPNYTFQIINNGAKFTILKRQLSLKDVYVEDKIYDKTVNASVVAGLANVVNNENVFVSLTGNFVSYDVGNSIDVVVDTNSIILQGEDKEHYILECDEIILKGNILPREVKVKANETNAIYGEDINFSYNIEGLIEGDKLGCILSISDNDVGQYDINLISHSNSNYTINYVSSKCNILPKDLIVYADAGEKIYGDSDPLLTYTTNGLINNDILDGNLDREKGENVGEYNILVGSLYNKNYNIILESNLFTITERQITAKITFINKIYDGKYKVDYIVSFDNNILQDEFILTLDATSLNKDCGKTEVDYKFISIEGNGIQNYTFNYEYLNNEILIERRDIQIVIESATKIYGDNDPTFNYTANNIIDGDILIGNIKRNLGEDVGQYTFYLDTLNNENNPNYNITLKSSSLFTIIPKNLIITTNDYEKIFGDEDPTFEIILADGENLCFDDTFESVFNGKLIREDGEYVGVYNYLTSELSTNKNYTFTMDEKKLFIINKRPVTVICDLATKIYGDEDPIYSYYVENEVEEEKLILDIKREYGEDVGKYKLVLSTISDSRYSITFVSNYLEILPSNITVKAESKVKVYGDEDPVFTVIVTSGLLKNNDILTNISNGDMIRQAGENVGSYTISQGTFNLGNNYNLTFENSDLYIIEEEINIKANYTSKSYGDQDPIIMFSINYGELKFNDTFIGSLSRDSGENVGKYNITIGTLRINENYKITLTSNIFEINKKTIEVIPTKTNKIYGDEEPIITYQLIGDIVDGDEFTGGIYRDLGEGSGENVGSYDIVCTLYNPNYNITFDKYYFEIVARNITIKADDKEIIYGSEEPELTYQIVEGNLVGEDKIGGSLYRIPGNNVGTYAIRSSLNLGKNYILSFINGTLTINPLDIKIEINNHEKIYGQLDPTFQYSIIEGELINGDILHGSITRAKGEDVGNYLLTSNIYNSNYNIEANQAYLTITPKDVYLVLSVYDKVYDGTTIAYIRNPYVTGLIDEDVVLLYDKENCARFETSQVGNNINVSLNNISLFGSKASNYHLIYPENITANITNPVLEDNGVKLESKEQAILYDGLKLNYSSSDIDNEIIKIEKHKSLLSYDIWLEGDETITELNSTVTLTIKVADNILDFNNIYVYLVDDDGNTELVSSYKENGNLIITTSNLGKFIITTDNDGWIDYSAYIGLGLVVLAAIITTIIMFVKKRKNKRSK